MKARCVAGLFVILPLAGRLTVSAVEAGQNPNHVIQQLKQQIGDQQQAVAALEKEVSVMLGELRSGRQDLQVGGAGGLRLEISYPQPGGAGAEAAISEAAHREAEEEAVAGPIPVMVIKPSSVADVENAMTQVMEQEAAMTGQQEAEVAAPAPYKVKSPEQEMDESIAAIDKLEAEKTHYKYDIENVQRNYVA
ncbi:conserved hypothetical protein [Neospora caninum Liverpool]|uniref:Tol-pal system protein YbgF n=1 Tax=Neospora caninum (strain Liverpool) TaxID=572307 RepID=F0VM15_NEOCL|nr:conserved hypothetical protein [Neospora caninum Liverpool]CBZ54293.1 conserved hypothetical protein [Neospora caninum Liverpool]CEL68999.1 TPA: hypothetical protein BN1204_047250 [Neospora caninum Liverpool]|eukprot:XP_003884324.1 conserved hypothetical protein [Neospora caninum Liverpool]